MSSEFVSKVSIVKNRYSELTDFSSQARIQFAKERYYLIPELNAIRSMRGSAECILDPDNVSQQIHKVFNNSLFLKDVRSALILVDEPIPVIFKGEKVTDPHGFCEDLIKKNYNDSKYRVMISGEIITTKSKDKYFMCDPIMLSNKVTILPSKRNYIELANILLNLGYIPVDAEFSIVPTNQ